MPFNDVVVLRNHFLTELDRFCKDLKEEIKRRISSFSNFSDDNEAIEERQRLLRLQQLHWFNEKIQCLHEVGMELANCNERKFDTMERTLHVFRDQLTTIDNMIMEYICDTKFKKMIEQLMYVAECTTEKVCSFFKFVFCNSRTKVEAACVYIAEPECSAPEPVDDANKISHHWSMKLRRLGFFATNVVIAKRESMLEIAERARVARSEPVYNGL